MKKLFLLGALVASAAILFAQDTNLIAPDAIAQDIASDPGVIEQLKQSLEPIGWVLLFLGWLMYWLKKADEYRMKDLLSWKQTFVNENTFEIPISLLSCLILAFLADEIPSDLIDMNGKISILLIGYGAGSILNGFISKFKK